ncbi:hypothetical protein HDZ31DRAFT_85439 [Schizophyllum fasciatum]
MASSSTVYLVSGANRGIGLALVALLTERPNTIVFAGARNPDAAYDLQALVGKHPNRVYTVELKACDEEGNARAIEQIRQRTGQLDVVIANAAVCKDMGPLLNATADSMREHFDVNVIGTLMLFQAAHPLMKTSPTRKFVVVGAHGGVASFGPEYGVPLGPYAVTKAAVHYLAKKLQFENEDFVIFPILPGLVATDMYQYAQDNSAYLAARVGITTAECATGLMRVVDGANREKTGGKLMDVDGGVNQW